RLSPRRLSHCAVQTAAALLQKFSRPVAGERDGDTGITASGGGIPGLLGTGASPLGAPTTAVQQDIDADAARVNSNPTAIIGDSWTWTNLSTFSSHGGKLIFYHGVSDPWFSAKDTIDYYDRMSAANGGAGKVKD